MKEKRWRWRGDGCEREGVGLYAIKRGYEREGGGVKEDNGGVCKIRVGYER